MWDDPLNYGDLIPGLVRIMFNWIQNPAILAVFGKPRPEKKGIPGFRARHQKMKAEWSEKWSATKEEWGDEDWGDGWDDEDWGDEDWGGEWEEGW